MRRVPIRAAGIGRALAAVVAAVIVLTSCGGIPREGNVRAGQADLVDESPAQVFLPSGPQRDASAESILLGFIDAASSPENNYAIAREFLTPSFSADWDPTAGVIVDDGIGRVVTARDEQTIQVMVTPIAEVSATGEYRESDSTPVPLGYQFVQVDGQWRIQAAPNGTVIDENTFNDVFSASALYFFDPGFDMLVPDLRWFPRGASAPTKIVNAVLSGPSSWLVGAVATAFPDGTKLTADAVRVVRRNAMVDLNSEALNADRITLERMKAQLTASLPSGMSVKVTIDQNPQDIADLGPAVNPRVDARALILREGDFGFLAASGQAVTPVDGVSDAIVGLAPTAVSLAAGQQAAVALAEGGVWRVRAGNDPELVDSRAGLIAPSIDNDGYTWSVPMNQPNDIVVTGMDSAAVSVASPWPEATTIQAMKVARDGTRIVVAYTIGAEPRLAVVGILRKDGLPIGLTAPLQLMADSTPALDVAWVDELTVASLSTLATGAKQISARELGGASLVLESPPDAVALAGSNSLRDLRAITSSGGLHVQRGVGWQKRLDGVTVLATQQGIDK
ncbi:LpqB family beta-propeller domain-containing protein [Cryobacterium psychrophilum]|nr:LpqB family beta-propeller domain-containing protein [Cryobacterium psychrophilum]TDW30743.1 lipoprotein LpqB-like beta-propeller protein [Cryobacterium psychrophilum]